MGVSQANEGGRTRCTVTRESFRWGGGCTLLLYTLPLPLHALPLCAWREPNAPGVTLSEGSVREGVGELTWRWWTL